MPSSETKGSPGSPLETAAGLYGVSKFFDSLWGGNLVRALTNVTFEVRRGEVFGLLGPAGAGKSTALKILAGRARAMEGKAEVFGRSPRSGSAKARVGYLPEAAKSSKAASTGLRESFNQLLGLAPEGTVRTTGGLMQALRNNPDLLLLDDPFGGLEEARFAEMKDKIRSLAKGGRTVVLTSRSLAEAGGLCDRVAVFRAGCVEAVGTIEELLASDGAVNLFAPILPGRISKRLAQVIREELAREKMPAPADSPAAAKASEPPGRKSATPEKSADPIDHERLAQLAKPDSRSKSGTGA